jgi:VanZ family protein
MTYASLRPFTGWQVPPLGWLALLHQPVAFVKWDVFLNVVGYVPLGFLTLLALASSRWPLGVTVLLSITCCVGYSFGMEVLQSALPTRTPNLADLITNTTGTLIGSGIALMFAPWLLSSGGLTGLRQRHVAQGWRGDAGIALIGFWALALLAPRTLLFGHGDARLLFGIPAAEGYAEHVFIGFEAVISCLSLIAFALLVRLTFSGGRWAIRGLLLLAIVGSLAVRTTGFGLFWTMDNAFNWVTPGAMIGLSVGTLLSLALVDLPQRTAAIGAALLLVASTVIVNVSPPNPYLWTKARPTRQMELAPVSMATRTAAMLWPLAAVVFMLAAAARTGTSTAARRRA